MISFKAFPVLSSPFSVHFLFSSCLLCSQQVGIGNIKVASFAKCLFPTMLNAPIVFIIPTLCLSETVTKLDAMEVRILKEPIAGPPIWELWSWYSRLGERELVQEFIRVQRNLCGYQAYKRCFF